MKIEPKQVVVLSLSKKQAVDLAEMLTFVDLKLSMKIGKKLTKAINSINK